jgi:hypothetical protein
MHIHLSGLPRVAAAALLSAVAGVAAADEADQQSASALPMLEAQATEVHAIAPADGTVATAAFGTPLDAVRLHRLRGGDSQVNNDVLVEGLVSDNTADGIVSGSNAISGGSFANASGINTVIQNTGTNVLIQNAMIVNVQFTGASP